MERWNIGPVDPFVLSTKHNQYRHRRTLRTHSKGTTSTKENDGTLWIYGYFNVLCCITYFAPHPPDSVPNANKTRSAACCRKPTHTSSFLFYFNASPHNVRGFTSTGLVAYLSRGARDVFTCTWGVWLFRDKPHTNLLWVRAEDPRGTHVLDHHSTHGEMELNLQINVRPRIAIGR